MGEAPGRRRLQPHRRPTPPLPARASPTSAAAGTGDYAFYTRARDNATPANYEAAPGAADTTTTINGADTTKPVSTASSPGLGQHLPVHRDVHSGRRGRLGPRRGGAVGDAPGRELVRPRRHRYVARQPELLLRRRRAAPTAPTSSTPARGTPPATTRTCPPRRRQHHGLRHRRAHLVGQLSRGHQRLPFTVTYTAYRHALRRHRGRPLREAPGATRASASWPPTPTPRARASPTPPRRPGHLPLLHPRPRRAGNYRGRAERQPSGRRQHHDLRHHEANLACELPDLHHQLSVHDHLHQLRSGPGIRRRVGGAVGQAPRRFAAYSLNQTDHDPGQRAASATRPTRVTATTCFYTRARDNAGNYEDAPGRTGRHHRLLHPAACDRHRQRRLLPLRQAQRGRPDRHHVQQGGEEHLDQLELDEPRRAAHRPEGDPQPTTPATTTSRWRA